MTAQPLFAGLKALVIGQGSIGQRHARILAEDGAEVSTLSTSAPGAFRSLEEAFARTVYDYIVIANETSRHLKTLTDIAELGYRGRLLIEKPVGDRWEAVSAEGFRRIGVAYNLRFHPVVDALRSSLAGHRVVDVRLHVGQYLADWRPGTDYRQGASARTAAGGGVLRDLSHELDLIQHLFGDWSKLTAIGGNRGVLDIETDENWSVLFSMKNAATATLTMNYFDRPAERGIAVTTPESTLRADLVAATLARDGDVRQFAIERDSTYRDQHKAMLDDGDNTVCTLDQGFGVLSTISAIERAGRENIWVSA